MSRRTGFGFVSSCALTLLLTAPALAQRAPFPIPDPEVERKSFLVAEGFEGNLFAADPVLAKPMAPGVSYRLSGNS